MAMPACAAALVEAGGEIANEPPDDQLYEAGLAGPNVIACAFWVMLIWLVGELVEASQLVLPAKLAWMVQVPACRIVTVVDVVPGMVQIVGVVDVYVGRICAFAVELVKVARLV